jgi:hypothetical protein
VPFHVTSADWEESDRLLAGILTAFGAETGAVPIGGRGRFDGVMIGAFKAPRIEGRLRRRDARGRRLRGQRRHRHREQLPDVKNGVIQRRDGSHRRGGKFRWYQKGPRRRNRRAHHAHANLSGCAIRDRH